MKFLQKIFNFIKYIDQFGVIFNHVVQNDSKYFKSVFSGLITVILYLSAFSYTIFQIQQYMNGQFLPRIQEQSVFAQNLDEQLEFSPFIINLQYTGDYELIKNKKIFDVQISETSVATGQSEVFDGITSDCNNVLNYQISYCFDPETQNQLFIQQNTTYFDSNIFTVNFYKCNSSATDCLDETQILSLLQKGQLWIIFVLQKQQFDLETQKYIIFQEIQYVPFDPSMSKVYNLNLIQQEIQFDNGILIDEHKKNSYSINKIEWSSYSQNIKNSKYYTLDQREEYFHLNMMLNSEQIQVKYQSIKLGEVLAQISSIINILFLFKYIGFVLNDFLLSHSLEEKILKIHNKGHQQKSLLQKLNMKFQYYVFGYFVDEFQIIYEQLSVHKIFDQLSQVGGQEIVDQIAQEIPNKHEEFEVSKREGDQSLSMNRQFIQDPQQDELQQIIEQPKDYPIIRQQENVGDDNESQEGKINEYGKSPPYKIPVQFSNDL